ncbi:MAG: peptidoglycan editing factor PgeF, partial [Candidatus Acidiferrum sp.]
MPPTALQSAVIRKRAAKLEARRLPAPHNWFEHRQHGLCILEVPALAKIPWLVHGFSTREGGVSPLPPVGGPQHAAPGPARTKASGKPTGNRGQEDSLNLGFTTWDNRKNVLENRRRFQTALGAPSSDLVTLKQFHSDLVRQFGAHPAEPLHADAAVTNHPGLLLTIQTADCVPILLVDSKKRAVAAIHAGWRGTLRQIAAKAVGHMQMHFGSKPSDLLAAIGPAIGACCYEVGTEIAADFLSQFSDAPDFFDEFRTGDEPNPIQWLNQMPPGHQPPPKNVLLDLHKANSSQLRAAGLSEKNIFASSL